MFSTQLLLVLVALSISYILPVRGQLVKAEFNDTRCSDGRVVCPNDPLLFTCTVSETIGNSATVTLPSGQNVNLRSDSTDVELPDGLPERITVEYHNVVELEAGNMWNYTLILVIERASLLTDSIRCDSNLGAFEVDITCPIATDPSPPTGVVHDTLRNTESSAVIEWRSPGSTGGNGITISNYTVSISGVRSETVSGDGRDVISHNITGLDYNTSYILSVTAINSCGLFNSSTTTSVFIIATVPPQPKMFSIVMECNEPLSKGLPLLITWTNGEREVGVVYPGEERATVDLTPGGTVCSSLTGNSCTAVITSDCSSYDISLTVSNDIGSAVPLTTVFDSDPVEVVETERGGGPAVAVTLNSLCTDSVPYTVKLSFGVREKDSGDKCLPQQNVTAILLPGTSVVLAVNIAALPLEDGQQYCYTTPELNIEGDLPTTTATASSVREGLSVGAVAALSVILTIVVFLPVGVVIGLCLPAHCLRRRSGESGGGRGGDNEEKKRKGKKQNLQTVIYEEPIAPSVETAISLSENQAYGQVNIQ